MISTRTSVIYTRRVRCWHVWVWLWHSRKWLWHSYVVTLVCDVHMHTVMNTRTSVISEHKVWFICVECNFHTQSVFATRRVWFPNAVWFWQAKMWLRHLQMWFQHAQEWFLHAECDVDTYEFDYVTQKIDYDTCTCQNHTLSVEITLLCDFHTHCVMNTRTNVISELKEWFQHARVWFIYVECDLYT
jgi:hypothetical protein